jgi:tetratricopeptide (TPR) repeat protein
MIEAKLRAARQLVAREDFQKAWILLQDILNEAPERPEALFLVGCVLRQQNYVGLALTTFRRALSLDQKQIQLWMHYGATLHDLCQFSEAREAFLHVSKMIPTDPMPWANLAAGYVQEGKARECIEYADKALALDPENTIAHVSKGFACLALGRWSQAWQHKNHLYGNQLNIRVYNDKDHEEPEWDGTPDQTVVVQCDQGLGDQIMFSQCLNDLGKVCKKVIIETSERMTPLMKRNFPFADVHSTLKNVGQDWSLNYKIDAHIHISFLGKFFRNKNEDFPRTPYLTPDPELVEKWKAWLKPYGRTIGISWKGGVPHTQRHLRSVELEDFAPIMELGGTFIDLSYQDNDREVALWNLQGKAQVIKPPINEKNYDDTVSLIAALDDIVTVTTTAAHVCGALGKHAYVLTPAVAQWRYAYHFQGGTQMIWYPEGSATLYRQKRGEEWDAAIKRVAKDLGNVHKLRLVA